MCSATILFILALASIGATSKEALGRRQTLPDQYDLYFGDQTRADTFTDYFTDSNGQAPGIDYTTGGAYITGSDYYTLPTDNNFIATETGFDFFSSAIETGAASGNIFETGGAIASRTSGDLRPTATGSRGGSNSNGANDDRDNGSNGGNNNDRASKNSAPGTRNAHVALTSAGLVALVGAMLML
jgi:hypothetical protein